MKKDPVLGHFSLEPHTERYLNQFVDDIAAMKLEFEAFTETVVSVAQ